MNINDFGAMAVSFQVFDLCRAIHFTKYCKEIPGEIRVLTSSHEY